MELPEVDIDELKLAAYNPQTMDEEEVLSLMASIQFYGQKTGMDLLEPIIANKDKTVMSGHQRIEACRRLGIKKVPVIFYPRLLPKEEEKAFNLAMNKIEGGFDLQKLWAQFDQMDEEARKQTGFTPEEIQELFDSLQTMTNDVLDKSDVAESLEVYNQGKIKQIVLFFSAEEYEKYMAKIISVMNELGVRTPTQAITHLINASYTA